MCPIRLSSSAIATITDKDIRTYVKITINTIDYTAYVISHSYNIDYQFSCVNCSIELNNEGNYFSGLKIGDIVTVEEGLYNSSNVLESFKKFKGIIRQLSPRSSGQDTLQITALDYIVKMQDTDIEKTIEPTDKTNITFMPSQTTGGVKLEETPISTNIAGYTAGVSCVLVDNAIGFEAGHARLGKVQFCWDGNSLTNTNGSTFYIVSVDKTNNWLITDRALSSLSGPSPAVDTPIRQLYSEMAGHPYMAQFFDFGYWSATQSSSTWMRGFATIVNGACQIIDYWWNPVKYVSPLKQPILNVHIIGNEAVDPKWDGFDIGYEVGQLQLQGMFNVASCEIWSYFWYYPESGVQYAEDILETLVTTADGYGNAIFTSSQLQNTKNAEDGVTVDNMYYNTVPVTISGITYESGRVWYHKYSNFKTNMEFADYTHATGKIIIGLPRDTAIIGTTESLNKTCKRYGIVIFNESPTTPTIGMIKSTKDYSFSTLQASGVKISVMQFTKKDTKTRFDAIKEVLGLVAPNYIMQYTGYDKVWSKYLRQNSVEDYSLSLIQSHTKMQDTDIYTRTKMYGYNSMPINIMPKKLAKGITVPPLLEDPYYPGETYTAFASQQNLVLLGNEGNKFKLGVDGVAVETLNLQTILPGPSYPVVWINGQKNSSWVVDNVPVESWGFYPAQTESFPTYNGIWVIKPTNFSTPINIYMGDVLFASTNVSSSKYNSSLAARISNVNSYPQNYYSSVDGVYKIRLDDIFSSLNISKFTSIDFKVYYGNVWELKNNYFLVDPDYVTLSEASKHTLASASFEIQGITGHGDSVHGWAGWLFDGDGYTVRFWPPDTSNGSEPWTIVLMLDSERVVSKIRFLMRNDSFGYYWAMSGKYEILCYTQDWKLEYALPLSGINYYLQPSAYIDFNLPTLVSKIKYIKFKLYKFTDQNLGVTRLVRDLPPYVNEYYDRILYGISEIEVFGNNIVQNIKADFWYASKYTPPLLDDCRKLHDGTISTQIQTIFDRQPLKGMRYIIFNFEQIEKMDAIDITGGFFIPNPTTPYRKYETKARYSIQYKNANIGDWQYICEEATNFDLSSGESKSFEKEQLGEDFSAKQLSIVIEDVDKLSGFGTDKWIVSLVEFAAYQDILLDSESKLIPATWINNITLPTINGDNFASFPSSGSVYVGSCQYTYTSKTNTTLSGVKYVKKDSININIPIDGGCYMVASDYIDINPENPDHVTYQNMYDPDYLLQKIGDKVYKNGEVSKYLNTRTKLKDMTKIYLDEFTKNVTKVEVNEISRPDSIIGDSVKIIDPVSNEEDVYFIEGISVSNGQYSFKLAKYY